MGLAGVEASLTLVASGARHAGWWLDWNTRPRAGDRCQGAPDRPVKATMQLMRAT